MRDLVATTDGPSSDENENENAARPFAFDVAQISVAYRADGGDGTFRGGTRASGSPPAWASRPGRPPSSATPPTTARRRRQGRRASARGVPPRVVRRDRLPRSRGHRRRARSDGDPRRPASGGSLAPRAPPPFAGRHRRPFDHRRRDSAGAGADLSELASVFAKPPPRTTTKRTGTTSANIFLAKKQPEGSRPFGGYRGRGADGAGSLGRLLRPGDFEEPPADFYRGDFESWVVGFTESATTHSTPQRRGRRTEDWYASGDPGTFEWDLDEEGARGTRGRRRREKDALRMTHPRPKTVRTTPPRPETTPPPPETPPPTRSPQMRCDEQLSVAAENAPTGAAVPPIRAASTAPRLC